MAGRIVQLVEAVPVEDSAPMFAGQPDVLTVGQVAGLLGVSAITVRREIARGRLACCHVGKCVRVTKEQLINYVKEAN